MLDDAKLAIDPGVTGHFLLTDIDIAACGKGATSTAWLRVTSLGIL